MSETALTAPLETAIDHMQRGWSLMISVCPHRHHDEAQGFVCKHDEIRNCMGWCEADDCPLLNLPDYP